MQDLFLFKFSKKTDNINDFVGNKNLAIINDKKTVVHYQNIEIQDKIENSVQRESNIYYHFVGKGVKGGVICR